jgi:hypothetical protein
MRDEKAGARQHAVANFGGSDGKELIRQGRVNAAGLHAACMAWAGLRRAAARSDPRELLWPPSSERPRSPFNVIEIAPVQASWTLKLIGDGGLHAYYETSRVVSETLDFFKALNSFDTAARPEEIADAVASLSGTLEPPLQPENVPNKIWRINRHFGVALIASTGDGRYFLTAALRGAGVSSPAL